MCYFWPVCHHFLRRRGKREAFLPVLSPFERCLQLTSCTIRKKTPYKNPDLFPGLGAENWSTGSGIGRPLMNIKLPQIIWGGGGVRVWMWDIHLSTLHVAIHLHVWEVTLFHSEQVHTFSVYPSVHPSIPQSTTLLLYAVMLSDTPPLPSLVD